MRHDDIKQVRRAVKEMRLVLGALMRRREGEEEEEEEGAKDAGEREVRQARLLSPAIESMAHSFSRSTVPQVRAVV